VGIDAVASATDPERRGKMFQPNFPAIDRARPTTCLRAEHAHSRSSPLCVELSLPALLTARSRENFFSETVAPLRKEKSHRRTQDRHAAARCVQKVPQHSSARPAVPRVVRSQRKMSLPIGCFNRQYAGDGVPFLSVLCTGLSVASPLPQGERTKVRGST